MADLSPRVLDLLVSVWPSPMRKRNEAFGSTPGTDEYRRAYAKSQFMSRAGRGLGIDMRLPELWGKEVLEIGCGHGGITCFLASLGVKRVVGIDLNDDSLRSARELKQEIDARGGRELPAELVNMDAAKLTFEPNSFDIVLADNLFEHVEAPERVLAEIHRVLRPGGLCLVPTFCSIRSKYGLHLKHGIKLPWANLIFSERTIVETLKLQAARRPELYDIYPGLNGDPQCVRDVRKHKDLNGIGHREFIDMARAAGFDVQDFKVFGTTIGKIVFRFAPKLGETRVGDVLSSGASAVLIKA